MPQNHQRELELYIHSTPLTATQQDEQEKKKKKKKTINTFQLGKRIAKSIKMKEKWMTAKRTQGNSLAMHVFCYRAQKKNKKMEFYTNSHFTFWLLNIIALVRFSISMLISVFAASSDVFLYKFNFFPLLPSFHTQFPSRSENKSKQHILPHT